MSETTIEGSTVYIERLIAVLSEAPDHSCLKHDGCDISRGELLARIYRFARALDSLGIGRGDIVALFAPNAPDALAVRYAAHVIGAGATFLSVPSRPEAREVLISAIDPKLLVVFPETASLVTPGIGASVAGVGFVPRDGFDLEAVAASWSSDPVACRASPNDMAVINSSGGSTGVPKGSWRTFAAYSAMVSVPSSPDRRQLVNAPLAYISQVLVDITLLGGGTVIFRDCYEAIDTTATIAAERITDLLLVEPQLFDLMDHPCLASADLSSIITLSHIGASAPPALRLRARERFGPRIVHTYGASEEGLISVLTAAEDDPANPEHFHSAGRVLPGVEVRFRRPDGTLTAAGETGSIEIRSPAMAQGYRNRPDLEAAAFKDGWYRSGDLGCLDVDGYLHIFGRAVDITFVDGRMVTPTLIEDTLCRVPEVHYASVVNDAEGERRIAVVLPRFGTSIDLANCLGAVRAEHGDAVARSILLLVRETMPLTPQGKPDREAIRALAQ